MATAGAGQLGVTAPLSIALPTEAELQASAALVDELKRQNNYESPAETNKRYVLDLAIVDEP
jgi:poly(A) polymerase